MEKCCTFHQAPRSQRRINGFQLPLNYQQVICWVVFLVTALLNFIILIEIQFHELKIASIITYVLLYVSHIGSHMTALMTDPSEKELRKLKVNNLPEFDRNVHAHVIENGRCHLCNIHTSSRNTKHCSICNKCVDHFDHHCKWLNNCVGQRNYAAFITCVTTALLISIFTTSLCMTDIILFIAYPQQLSSEAQNYFSCNTVDKSNPNKYCQNSISFLTFLIIFCVCALAIACALLHLCCFHIYISVLGVTTYEYIVKSGTLKTSQSICFKKRSMSCTTSNTTNSRHKKKCSRDRAGSLESDDNTTQIEKTVQTHGETNAANLINILLSNELDRAKKIFFYNKNKIHPQNETNSS